MDSRKRPFMCCWFISNSLYVRFQNVDDSYFSTVLKRFKTQFPKARWCPDCKAWELPKTDLQNVALFTYEVFGKRSLRFLDDDTPRQLTLPFNRH
jgi:hypothetical protein